MAAGFFRGRPAFATVQTECSKISKAGANIIFIEKRRFSSASCYEVTFVKVKIRHPTNFLPDDHICLHFQLLEGALI